MKFYSILLIFLCLWANCLQSGNALFFKTLKGLKHYGNSGYGGYASGYPRGYSNNYYAGYGGYGGSVGYGGYEGYGNYRGYGNYGGYSRPARSQRTGRTYSDISRVLVQDRYLGLGAGRYLAPYSKLWG